MNVVVDDLLPKHPLIYDSYNLCELFSKGKFTTFAASVLREMCCSFGIDVEDIHVKRRKPYTDRLQSLCDACTCKLYFTRGGVLVVVVVVVRGGLG